MPTFHARCRDLSSLFDPPGFSEREAETLQIASLFSTLFQLVQTKNHGNLGLCIWLNVDYIFQTVMCPSSSTDAWLLQSVHN
jgi:hypothetical protein